MKCAVLGSPVAHSLSPVMHLAAYAELGLDWSYEALEVSAGGLAELAGAVGDDVRGFSVTAPLKREAADVAHERSAVVELLGIANTLVREDDRWHADNTDVPGAVAALAERQVESPGSARILGAGATAASIAHALAGVGLERVELVVRDAARAADAVAIARGSGLDVTVAELGALPSGRVDLLVSTVPADAVAGEVATTWIEAADALFDVVYDPWPTPLASAAQAAGVPIVSGLDLLAHQAVLQVEQMTGSPVSVTLLRDAALAELAVR